MRLIPFEYAVRNLGRSPTRCAVALGGSLIVVLLVLIAAAFVRGMDRALAVGGREDNIIILGAGSEESVERSELDPSAPGIIGAGVPGIRSRLKQSYVSAESHVQLLVRSDPAKGTSHAALFRGVTPAAFLVYPHVRVCEGRLPATGRNELLVGRMAGPRLAMDESALRTGAKLWLDGQAWTVVGRFEAPGSVMESEIWAPLEALQLATKRTTYSCVVVTMGDADFADVDAFCKQRLDLQLVAIPEKVYYAALLDFFGPIRGMVWATAAMLALGGLFGGLNTMYAAFASRIRELAALQTLGFSRRAILLSLVQESVVISCAGAIGAAFVGMVFLDGVAVRSSMGAFGLVMDASVIALGMMVGLLLGFLGALPPAVRCLRPAISDALRAA